MASKNGVDKIYLIRTREFIDKDEDVYKLGKSKRRGTRRSNEYPVDSEVYLIVEVDNCANSENRLKEKFRKQFGPPKYGNEWFKGDRYEMMELILKERKTKEINLDPLKNIKNTEYKNLNWPSVSCCCDITNEQWGKLLYYSKIMGLKCFNNIIPYLTTKIPYTIGLQKGDGGYIDMSFNDLYKLIISKNRPDSTDWSLFVMIDHEAIGEMFNTKNNSVNKGKARKT